MLQGKALVEVRCVCETRDASQLQLTRAFLCDQYDQNPSSYQYNSRKRKCERARLSNEFAKAFFYPAIYSIHIMRSHSGVLIRVRVAATAAKASQHHRPNRASIRSTLRVDNTTWWANPVNLTMHLTQ